MRALILSLALAAGPHAAIAQDQSTAPVAEVAATAGGVMFNTSISLNLPLLGADPAAKQAEEEAHRKELYARSVRECDILLESIAKSCTITGISVSSQTNSSPGQADYLYASSSIAMQVELK